MPESFRLAQSIADGNIGHWSAHDVVFSGVDVSVASLQCLLVQNVTLYAPGGLIRAQRYSGGYCGGVPPLPIPNREVKPACADGTAMQCGRVGSRHLFLKKRRSPSVSNDGRAFLCIIPPIFRTSA